jgi:hypothetical protein
VGRFCPGLRFQNQQWLKQWRFRPYASSSVSGQKNCTKFVDHVQLAVIDQVTWRHPAMRGRKPNRLRIRPVDESNLLQIARSPGLPWFQMQRARKVLARAAGDRTGPDQFQCDEATVWRTCRRYRINDVADLLADDQKALSGRYATISPPPAGADRRTSLLESLGQGAAHHPLVW